ncbi:MAG: hypothetical protein R3F35_12670 [Myxococcota bacterium]
MKTAWGSSDLPPSGLPITWWKITELARSARVPSSSFCEASQDCTALLFCTTSPFEPFRMRTFAFPPDSRMPVPGT